MISDLEQAKKILTNGSYSCVLYKNEVIYTSTKRGIAPLLDWLTDGVDLRGFSAADKIIGKAAALLFIQCGVKEVYAPVMSERAAALFLKHGIPASCDTLVEAIINRAGTGICPMEQATTKIDNPAESVNVLRKTLADLQKKTTLATQK